MAGTVFAAAPKLIQTSTDVQPPSEVQPGHTYSVSIHYEQDNGDYPSRLVLVIDPPNGQEEVIPPTTEAGDPKTGFPAVFSWTPQQSGAYRLHFEAASKVEPNLVTRYPDSPGNDFQVGSTSLTQKYITFFLLLILTLLLLPYLVFVVLRAANKNADPSTTARTALLVAILASYMLYVYLFYAFSGPLIVILVGIAAVAVLAFLLTRRR
jgi:hypothetical protein